jgi:hypothetical protein
MEKETVMSIEEHNFKLAMQLLDKILDGVVCGEDLARFTGLSNEECQIIISEYYKLRNAT